MCSRQSHPEKGSTMKIAAALGGLALAVAGGIYALVWLFFELLAL